MIVKRGILILALMLFVTSPSWGVTTQADNDLLIRQAWRAGQQLIENGMYRRGVEYLEAYVNNRPGSADGWYWLAKGYQGMGMLSKSQKAFTQALEVDPEYPPLSRVLQNRATGEAVPLMDPAGSVYKQGLPVIYTDRDVFNDRVIGRPAPVERMIQAPPMQQMQTPAPMSTQPVYMPSLPQSPPAMPEVDERFSPMGARKVVISPSAQIKGTNPVVPIPPVAALTGEPEGPGIPMIDIPDSPTNRGQVYSPPTAPVQAAPAPVAKPVAKAKPAPAPVAKPVPAPVAAPVLDITNSDPLYVPPAPSEPENTPQPQSEQPVYAPPAPKTEE